MLTPQMLADRVNSGTILPEMAEVAAHAAAAVTEYLRANLMPEAEPPFEAVARAELDVAAHLWYQRNPGGLINTAFGADGDAFPIRISRDPLAPARSILAQWCVPLGFA